VGLAGEMRPVPRGQERLREAAKLGFKRAIVPAANVAKRMTHGDIAVFGAKQLREALAQFLMDN
jgi:DNA repair protein RadA/Sms